MTERNETMNSNKETDSDANIGVQPVVMRLNELKTEKDAIKDSLKSVNDEIKSTALELMKLQHGVYAGCVVITGEGREALVTFVETDRWDYKHNKPWLKGRLKKKDGEFGINERHLCADWELAS